MAAKSLSEILNGETRFGRLALIGEADPTFNKRGTLVRHAMFRCDCGAVKRIQVMSVKSGVTKSCGCLKRENASVLAENTALRHGDARARQRAPEYGIYRAMLSRCYNPKVERYPEYGGRGITVADEWRGKGGYERFLAHVGRRPDADQSLDRIDPDGNYCPGNVRWVVKDVQANNKRNSVRFRVGDERLTLKAMSERSGVGIATLRYRLKIGMTAEAAMRERIKTGPNASP